LDSLCYIKISSEERPYLELEVVYQKKNSDDQCYDNFEDYEINGNNDKLIKLLMCFYVIKFIIIKYIVLKKRIT